MERKRLPVIAVDIGAGFGVKLGVFEGRNNQIAESVVPREEFEDDFERLVARLLDAIERLLHANGRRMKDMAAVGIASPGLFRSDGSYLLIANLGFLMDKNLRVRIEKETGLPTAIENDANAGGLAEWSAVRTDLLYWVFGGGWGGVWITEDGSVKHPAVDWDGDDATLHPTNEPGYAIGLDKWKLRTLFYEFKTAYSRFEEIVLDDLGITDGELTGPGGNPDTIRAEVILSGPGRCRLFRALVGDNDFYKRFLEIDESDEMSNTAVAGEYISKLSNLRVEAAINTDRLFGRVLAQAAFQMMQKAREDGMRDAVPICLGGKPSYALPYFGPSAQRHLGAFGIFSYLQPSIIDLRGLNANLVGAAVLAEKAHLAKG
jgi:hypothetical protein